MKRSLSFLFLLIVAIACKQTMSLVPENDKLQITQIIDTSDVTNNFYDNTETFPLPVKDIFIDGEISNPGKVVFSSLPVRSVIVKETLIDSAGGDKFVGAYRYDGYSVFDVLNNSVVNKVNSKEFRPVIDLYVELENDKGDKVVFSWGEIYYPNSLHKILIAKGVSRIVPSKTKELWPLPVEGRIIAGNDLVTERNIASPVKITVRSYHGTFTIQQGMSPMYSPQIDLYNTERKIGQIKTLPADLNYITYNTIFYGRGKGIHSTEPFSGVKLKDLLLKNYPLTRENLKSGIICIAAKDGYRSVISYSELFNRNDQQEFILVKTDRGEDGGLFRIFPAADFFSDRAVKSVSEIHLIN